MKDSFVLYTSQYMAIRELEDEQLGRLFRALFEKQLGNEVVLTNDIKIAFNFINNQMVIDNEKYLKKCETLKNNAKKGGAPKGNQNAKKQKQPNREKNNLNDNDNDNDNEIILNDNLNNNIIAQNEHKTEKKQSKTLNEELFNKFWDIFPKKKSKGDAKNWFIKHQPSEELVNLMIEKIRKLKETKEWKQDNGQYIPYPTTWLNAEGWEDEIDVDKKKDDSFPYELYKQYYDEFIGEYYFDSDYKRVFGRVPRDDKH